MPRSNPNPVHQIAEAIERIRLDRGEVFDRDIVALGFSPHQVKAFADDARAKHAQLYPHAVAA
jgi:hypothetical protein